ncbi:MAG: HK97 family phage prohead protease [Methylocystis sp.]|uniref:HK97 family phage prohead protease n=1 Tax=Methylocystis sp. TaxID=1911079 RepID=UPI003DA28CB8
MIRIIRDFQNYRAGQVLALPEHEASALVFLGVAAEGPSGRFVGDIPILTRKAAFTGDAPRTVDEAERTVDVVMSTGAAVRRSDWIDGEFLEVLEISAKAIRMDRLQAGAPLLDSHNYWGGVDAILGAVVPGSARIERGALWGRVKFSRSEAGERAWQDVRDGVLRSVSVGYLTHAFKVDDRTSPPTRTATDWEVYELSAVAVPADAAAGFRGVQAIGSRPSDAASPAELARVRMGMTQRAVDAL